MLLRLPPLCVSLAASKLSQKDRAALLCCHPSFLASAEHWWDSAAAEIPDQQHAGLFQAWLSRVNPPLRSLKLVVSEHAGEYPVLPVVPRPDALDSLDLDFACADPMHPLLTDAAVIAPWVAQFANLVDLDMFKPLSTAEALHAAETGVQHEGINLLAIDDLNLILAACPLLERLAARLHIPNGSLNRGQLYTRTQIWHPKLSDVCLYVDGIVDVRGCPRLETLRLEGVPYDDSALDITCPPSTHTMSIVKFASVAVDAPGLASLELKHLKFFQINVVNGVVQIVGVPAVLHATPASVVGLDHLKIMHCHFEDPEDCLHRATRLTWLMSANNRSPWMAAPGIVYPLLRDMELGHVHLRPGDLAGLPALEILRLNTCTMDDAPGVFGDVAETVESMIVKDMALGDMDLGVLAGGLKFLMIMVGEHWTWEQCRGWEDTVGRLHALRSMSLVSHTSHSMDDIRHVVASLPYKNISYDFRDAHEFVSLSF